MIDSAKNMKASRLNRVRRSTYLLAFAALIGSVVTIHEAHAAELPRDVALMIQEGNELLAKNRAKEALEAFDKAKGRAPDSPEIAFNRGVALYRMGEFDKAQSAFQDALKPERPDLEARAKYNLARTAHASALARKDDPQNSVNDLTRAVGFYNDTLALKPDDADATRNLDMARRMQAFLQKRLEQQKQEQQPSSQPGDKNDSSSQPSDEKQQGDQSSKSDQENKDEQQQQGSESSESDSNSNEQQASSQPNENEEQPESNDNQSNENEDENNQNGNEASEQEQQGEKENKSQEQQSEATSQPEQEATSQPEDQSTTQPTASATSQPTSMPSGENQDMQDISKEQANRLLQEARDSERQRRQMKRAMMLRRQGRVTVEKDW